MRNLQDFFSTALIHFSLKSTAGNQNKAPSQLLQNHAVTGSGQKVKVLTHLARFPDCDDDGHCGNEQDAGGIDLVFVDVPEDHAEQLEDVEWRQHLPHSNRPQLRRQFASQESTAHSRFGKGAGQMHTSNGCNQAMKSELQKCHSGSGKGRGKCALLTDVNE